MGRGVRDHGGGIRGLAQLIAQHGEAIEFELIERGLRIDRLGSKHLTWRDLKVIVRHLPPGNALERARMGEAAQWGRDTYLLALIADQLGLANWQRAGDRNRKKPKPVPRPTLPGAPASAAPGERVIARGQGMTMEAMAARLGWGDVDGGNAAR